MTPDTFFSATQRPSIRNQRRKLTDEEKSLVNFSYEELISEDINKYLIDFLATRSEFVQKSTYIFNAEFWASCFIEVRLLFLSTIVLRLIFIFIISCYPRLS